MTEDFPLTGNWNYPTTVRFGAGRIRELPECCRSLGMERPLLVTDPGLAKLPLVADALANTLNGYVQEVCPVSRPLKKESGPLAASPAPPTLD